MDPAEKPERLEFRFPWSPTLERIADRVWLVRGDLRRGMNVYLIEDEGGGVTQFDAGTESMTSALRKAHERLGGLNRIVLGHSHSDHRGAAPGLGGPVLCHPDEVGYAEKPDWRDTDYWRMDTLSSPTVRFLYERIFHDRWDGGAVTITETLSEGDEVSGFEVVHFPGHAPGLIGLWRSSDRLMLCSDTVYFADSETLKPLDYPNVPHPCWSWDHEQAIASVRKFAELEPRTVSAGHDRPHSEPGGFGPALSRAVDAGRTYWDEYRERFPDAA